MSFEYVQEIVTKMTTDKKEALYSVVGKTFVTGKKQSTTKAIYSTLNPDEKRIFKFLIEKAMDD